MASKQTIKEARMIREHGIAREINCWECQYYNADDKYCRKGMVKNPRPRWECKYYFRYGPPKRSRDEGYQFIIDRPKKDYASEEQASRIQNKLTHSKTLGSKRDLLQLIIQAFEKAKRDEGWAYLADLGNSIKQLDPDFNTRTYGYSKLNQIIRAYQDVFEIKIQNKTGPSQVYIHRKEKGVVPEAEYRDTKSKKEVDIERAENLGPHDLGFKRVYSIGKKREVNIDKEKRIQELEEEIKRLPKRERFLIKYLKEKKDKGLIAEDEYSFVAAKFVLLRREKTKLRTELRKLTNLPEKGKEMRKTEKGKEGTKGKAYPPIGKYPSDLPGSLTYIKDER